MTEKLQRKDFLKNTEHGDHLKVKVSEAMETVNLWKTILNSVQEKVMENSTTSLGFESQPCYLVPSSSPQFLSAIQNLLGLKNYQTKS